MVLNPTIKARWVAALRSGRYQQTKGRLRREDSYCCLGVLCALYAQELGSLRPDAVWRPDGQPHARVGDYEFDSQVGHLPTSVAQWAGFPLHDFTQQTALQDLNDGTRTTPSQSFAAIATYIETLYDDDDDCS